jgi:hypothetical protein
MQPALLWRGMLVPLLAMASITQTAPSQLVVGQHALRQLNWIAGRWEGTRDGASEFVEFAFDNDSTITVIRFADRKFSTPRNRMVVVLANHRIDAMAGAARWTLNGLDSTSASFLPAAASNFSFIWRQESARRWIEVRSWPPGVDKAGRSETWTMRRVK